VIDDQWGAPTGAALIAETTAKAINVAGDNPAMHGIYHLAPGGETTWYGYARYVIERARSRGWPVIVAPDDIVPVGTEAFPTPAKRPLNSRLDCHRLEQSLGMRMPDWREGVAAVVDEIAATAAKKD
jgi:dTDP-4-dehydrorhamnose reductase